MIVLVHMFISSESASIVLLYSIWLKVTVLHGPRNDVASNDVASQLVVHGMVATLTPAKTCKRVMKIRLGTFNVGIMQAQLVSDKSKRKVIRNLNRIIEKCVLYGDLDAMSMCEVGGHLEGMSAAGISAGDLPILQQGFIGYAALQNYLSCWNFNADAPQLGFQQLRPPKMLSLYAWSIRCDPQLNVQVFSQTELQGGLTVTAKLVQGNLHIRTPHGSPSPSSTMRKRIVEEALTNLMAAEELEKDRQHDDSLQPVVCVLLGDPNLSKAEGVEAVQHLQPVVDANWDHS